jgi:glycosyltransferase involved in cell wall biosynthesis
MRIGYFPFAPGENPYQRLFAQALEAADETVVRIPPRKLFPLQAAVRQPVDLLQLDWPHDWYGGRNAATRAIKQLMYRDGLRRLRRLPVVWTAHNLAAHDAADPAFERRMIQSLIDACDGVIVLSRASEALLRESYSVGPDTRVEIIHHGHYIGCYPNRITRDDARRRLGLPHDARIVISLGRLQPYKGLEELIDAFTAIARPGNVLLLAGSVVSDDYRLRLRAASAAATTRRPDVRIEIRDALVPDDELQVCFNACDVVALPFRKVLNSGSLLLAMSFGCPVVAPRLGSIPEVACPDGWFGYEAGDAAGLRAALESALAVRDRSALRQRVLDFTAKNYDWRSVGTKAANLYSDITSRAGPRPRLDGRG